MGAHWRNVLRLEAELINEEWEAAMPVVPRLSADWPPHSDLDLLIAELKHLSPLAHAARLRTLWTFYRWAPPRYQDRAEHLGSCVAGAGKRHR